MCQLHFVNLYNCHVNLIVTNESYIRHLFSLPWVFFEIKPRLKKLTTKFLQAHVVFLVSVLRSALNHPPLNCSCLIRISNQMRPAYLILLVPFCQDTYQNWYLYAIMLAVYMVHKNLAIASMCDLFSISFWFWIAYFWLLNWVSIPKTFG